MIEAVFDTNLIIDVEEQRIGYQDILELLNLEKQNKIRVYIPVIIASEKLINRKKVSNYKDFINYMRNMGFENTRTLTPPCYLGISYIGYCLIGPIPLVGKILSKLFPHIESKYKDYCRNRGINQDAKALNKWRNYLIDAIILWSAVNYKKEILVTRDKNFHKHKYMIKTEWNIDVKLPKDLVNGLKKQT